MRAAIIYESAALFALLAQAAGGENRMGVVTTDVGKYLPDATAALVRAKVLDSHWQPQEERTEAGTVTLKVVETYRKVRAGPKLGDVVKIEGTRSADPMGRQIDLRNPWNALPLKTDEELLLALHPGSSDGLWIPLAMAPFDGHDAGLKEAVAIEAMPPHHRLPRLKSALESDSYLLRSYALSDLKRQDVATRTQGAVAIAHAFESTDSVNVRLMLFAEMESRTYFQENRGPDPANVAILSAWLKVILRETDPERRASFLNHLAAAIGSKLSDDPAEDKALRARFAAAVQDPPRKEVAAMFRSAAAANPADPRYQRLAEAWAD